MRKNADACKQARVQHEHIDTSRSTEKRGEGGGMTGSGSGSENVLGVWSMSP